MYTYSRSFDVLVIGGGHAGVEAALASARMGCQTMMLSINVDTIGQMSCNPAIEDWPRDISLVRSMPGGEMGKVIDMTGIQFRMLNTKKGPSVWAPRANAIRKPINFG